MKIDTEEITRVARLARLELSDDEKSEFSNQLSDIISYVEKINELETDDIEPPSHIVDLKNVFREDKVKDSLDVEQVEKISPQFRDGHIIVPKIIDVSK